MAELPLSQTVDASRSERSWRSSALSLLTSTLVQGLVIAALIITPLLVAQAMPEPVSALTLPPFVPVTIAPPIARGPEPSADRKPTTSYKPTLATDALVHPVEFPDEIGVGDDTLFADGVPDGVPEGFPSWMFEHAAPPAPAAEPAPEPEPVAIVGNVRPPRKVVHVNPVYPRVAAIARIQGIVKIQAIIDAEGRIVNLKVVKSIALLDRAAIDAVQQWRYEPTILNGRAVPIVMTVEVEFKLR